MDQSTLPRPKDLSHHLSRVTKARVASKIKQFYRYFAIPGVGQLAGGLPNQEYFPFDTLEAKSALPDRWTPTPVRPVDPPSQPAGSSSKSPQFAESHLVVPSAAGTTDVYRKIDLTSALQYGTAQGYPALYGFVKQFTTQHLHPNIPYADGLDIILTCGSTDGFSKVLQALNNEWSEGHDPIEEREGLLVEKFCYMNPVGAARPRGMNIVPVALDDEGMVAGGEGGLQDVLENWDFSRGKRPRLLYTVTIGQNPTSGTLSVERRKELYAICQKYDVIIIEDDPYWSLQFPASRSESATGGGSPPPNSAKSSGYPFLDSLVPSYLSVDVDGRVIRLDTFSKTIAPGCRLGWITAQPALIERILLITECTTTQPSGFVQSIIAELLMGPTKGGAGSGGAKDGSGWNMDGWVRWLEGLRGEYERRMNGMCDILDKGKLRIKSGRRNSLNAMMGSLSTRDEAAEEEEWSVIQTQEMYSYDRPLGGMFLWIRFAYENHPLASKVPGPRLSHALWVFLTTPAYRVLVCPGEMFCPTDQIRVDEGWKYVRICFAASPKEDLDDITKRLVKGVKAFWAIRTVEEIDEILKDEEEDTTLYEVEGMGTLMGFC